MARPFKKKFFFGASSRGRVTNTSDLNTEISISEVVWWSESVNLHGHTPNQWSLQGIDLSNIRPAIIQCTGSSLEKLQSIQIPIGQMIDLSSLGDIYRPGRKNFQSAIAYISVYRRAGEICSKSPSSTPSPPHD